MTENLNELRTLTAEQLLNWLNSEVVRIARTVTTRTPELNTAIDLATAVEQGIKTYLHRGNRSAQYFTTPPRSDTGNF
jgi:N-acetylmuramic acid 6-phosphate (MurNAc-6-P) etherase